MSIYTDEEGIINVSAIIASISQRAVPIVVVTLAISAATFGWMLMLPEQYQAEVHLISTNNDEQLSFGGAGGDLGGIASLAGFDSRLGSDSRLDRLALDVIQTHSFAADFLSNQPSLIPLLIAIQGWDLESSTVEFDDSLYSPDTGWVNEPITEIKKLEQLWSAVYQFEKRLEVTESSTTNMVTLAFEHESPSVAANVLEQLQLKINSQMRESVIQDSKRNIEYLTEEATNTSVADLKGSFLPSHRRANEDLDVGFLESRIRFQEGNSYLNASQSKRPTKGFGDNYLGFYDLAFKLFGGGYCRTT